MTVAPSTWNVHSVVQPGWLVVDLASTASANFRASPLSSNARCTSGRPASLTTVVARRPLCPHETYENSLCFPWIRIDGRRRGTQHGLGARLAVFE
jgi:hypothetical protein